MRFFFFFFFLVTGLGHLGVEKLRCEVKTAFAGWIYRLKILFKTIYMIH